MRALCALVLGFSSACNAVFDIEGTKPRPPDAVVLTPRTLVFDNSASTIDLVDMPVLVQLDAGRVGYSDVADPSSDLRFEADGVDLPFEVEHWDPEGTSAVWVKVPKIRAGSRSDRILMHYGAEAGGREDPPAVWTDYSLVIHCDGDFHATVGATLGDLTGNVTAVPGVVGNAMRLGGTSADSVQYATTVPVLDSWPTYTFEVWLYADYPNAVLGKNPATGTSYEPRFFDDGSTLRLGRLTQTGNPYLFQEQIDTHYATGSPLYRPTYVPPRHWFQLVQSFDGLSQLIYRNAIVSDYIVITGNPTTSASTGAFVLGGDQGSAALDGMLDELRISKKPWSPDWIEAQYKAMTGSFVTSFLPGEAPPP